MKFIFCLIIAVVLYFVIAYFKDTSSEKNTIARQGGMYGKYRVLINHYKQQGLEITKQTGNSITLYSYKEGNYIKMIFDQVYNKLWVKMEMHNSIWGTHQLDWEFSEMESQELMIRQIDDRVKQYTNNLERVHLRDTIWKKMMLDD